MEGRPDSLIVTIEFEDNEGDLGEGRDQSNEANYIIIKDAAGNPIKFGSSPELPPYHACDYLIRTPTLHGVEVQDTVLIELDQMFYNFWIKFFIKRNGQFEEYDIRRAMGIHSCEGMDGRFFRLNTQPNERPLQGSLRYGMASHIFGGRISVLDTLKLEVQIRDNFPNKSNIVESPEFTLQGVRAE